MIHARKDYDRIQDPANKIREDEPVMLFRAQDSLMPTLLLRYWELLRQIGADPKMIKSVHNHIGLVQDWQRKHGCKLPDMPADAVREE